MRELTTIELSEVSGGVQFGLDYDQGANFELALAGIAVAAGLPVVAGFAFSAAILLSVVGYASNNEAAKNGTTGGAGNSGSNPGSTWNATGGSHIEISESS